MAFLWKLAPYVIGIGLVIFGLKQYVYEPGVLNGIERGKNEIREGPLKEANEKIVKLETDLAKLGTALAEKSLEIETIAKSAADNLQREKRKTTLAYKELHDMYKALENRSVDASSLPDSVRKPSTVQAPGVLSNNAVNVINLGVQKSASPATK